MSLYQNKYRIETARLQGWNYVNAGAYFITICTKDRLHWFGSVDNGKMILSHIGLIVKDEWSKTPALRPDMNLMLDEFVVMPNHFHGIIFIGDNEYNRNAGDGRDAMHGVSNEQNDQQNRDAMHGVSTGTPTNPGTPNKFGPQFKNLPSVIRGFKSAVTAKARLNDPDFAWQERYHDHIIRDKESFTRIQNYIMNNPANWKQDKFFSL
jgi:REP element-mobilizing transposase RayT